MAKKFPEIKEKNKGKFTRWVKKNMPGKSTCDAASTVMNSPKKYNSSVVKMANYAHNFGCSTKSKSPAKAITTGAFAPQNKKKINIFDLKKRMAQTGMGMFSGNSRNPLMDQAMDNAKRLMEEKKNQEQVSSGGNEYSDPRTQAALDKARASGV